MLGGDLRCESIAALIYWCVLKSYATISPFGKQSMLERECSPILGCRAGLGSRLSAQAAHYSSVRFFGNRIPWSLIGAAVTSNQTISCLMQRVMHISLTSMLPFIIRSVGYTLVSLGVWHIWLPKSLDGKDTHGVSTGGVLVSQSTSCCSDDVHLMGAHLRR